MLLKFWKKPRSIQKNVPSTRATCGNHWMFSILTAHQNGGLPDSEITCGLTDGTGVELEGQQQVLRAYFDGIYMNVRQLLLAEIGKLNYRNRKTKDGAVKAERDRLNAELEKLPEQWNFFVR
jgi:hypothetical protein